MLHHLSIRDVVLIDQLDLDFAPGLGVLTGETGAGKSILLDALGLALGARGDAGLVRGGSEQAVVTASFVIPPDHAVISLLHEQSIAIDDDTLILRRVLGADGRSRAFVNDQPVSIGLQRRIGDMLVEIHGQFESHGLLDSATHLGVLDSFAGLTGKRDTVASAHAAAQAAREALDAAQTELAENNAREAELRAIAEELDSLSPQAGEEADLAGQREMMQHAEQLLAALGTAQTALSGDDGQGVGGQGVGGQGDGGQGNGGAEQGVQRAVRSLEKLVPHAGGRFDLPLAALQRSAAELSEAIHALNIVAREIDADPQLLETIEERLFALRGTARKHGVAVDALPELHNDIAQRLDALSGDDARLMALTQAYEAARRAYMAAAENLSKARHKAAKQLDAAVMGELPPLRLEKAQFATLVERAPETAWGATGIDRASFVIATNPGSKPGALARIASGGELSRFMLALKVVLSATSGAAVMIFDEVDAGVGGATAAAVGDRLSRLAEAGPAGNQILVVTHSPQVAAVGETHWHVSKTELQKAGTAVAATRVERLDAATRLEEIARMLAGAAVTDEARAAAARLLDRPADPAVPARAAG